LRAFPALLNRISAFFFLFSNVSIQWFLQVLRIDRYAHKYLRLDTAMVVVQCRPVWFLWGMRLLIRMWATTTGSVKSLADKTKIISEAFPWRMETFCKWRLHVRLGDHGFLTEVEK
jgi:hypothetical protein